MCSRAGGYIPTHNGDQLLFIEKYIIGPIAKKIPEAIILTKPGVGKPL